MTCVGCTCLNSQEELLETHTDLLSRYRFTAEMEVYTDSAHYMKGIAKCLVDKLMALLDPGYIERAGYDIVGDEIEGGGTGAQRTIQNIIINLPYHKPEHLEWMSRWFSNWLGFKQVGSLEGIAMKSGKRYVVFLPQTYHSRMMLTRVAKRESRHLPADDRIECGSGEATDHDGLSVLSNLYQ